jgi:hypothetical protein
MSGKPGVACPLVTFGTGYSSGKWQQLSSLENILVQTIFGKKVGSETL